MALLTGGAGKASLVILRSTDESWVHAVFIDVHVDEQPFVRLRGGEYVRIHLPDGHHVIRVVYDRYSGAHDTAEALWADELRAGDVRYLMIVPSFEGTDWVWDFPSPVPLPMPGAQVALLSVEEGEARRSLGRAIDGELLRQRRAPR